MPPEPIHLPVIGFMHIATIGRWRQVVDKQIALLRSSGLWDRMSSLRIGIVGPESNDYNPQDDKISVVHHSPNLDEYEFPTLADLHALCAHHSGYVFYLHTKGVYRDTPCTSDWRKYLEYFVIERHRECLMALQSHDVCGVDWHLSPWPHFSGNFWWAKASYVAGLVYPSAMAPNDPATPRRHDCERWIGSGPGVRAFSMHQSNVDHYLVRYPRSAYAGEDAPRLPARRLRIAVTFDNQVRPDTTGIYCLRALRELAEAHHVPPSALGQMRPDEFDLHIYIDDGLDYKIPRSTCPTALWAIDTHIQPSRMLRRAKSADYVLTAQRDGVTLLRDGGIACVGWLPLACDPVLHAPHNVSKDLDVCFVGHLGSASRQELAGFIRERYERSFVGQRFFDEMAKTYSATRIVLNLSVVNDVNMRVFEALGCGAFLLTNDLRENGLDRLLVDGQHLVTYRDLDDLAAKLDFYLSHPDDRERIAAAGRAEVLAHHTYRHRMQVLLDQVAHGRPPKTSIIIPTFNQLAYTRLCLDSIRTHTPESHELIIVDNGSTDGTREYLKSCVDVRLIENPENRGYPTAVNQGIQASKGDDIVLLNNDVVVTPGWLTRLNAALYSGNDIGLAGPCTNATSGDQQVDVDYTYLTGLDEFASAWSLRHNGQRAPTNRLVGFCMMFRRDVLNRIGLLDERFGIGNFEDDDFCRRARVAGFRALIARDCFVHHFGSVTFRASGVDFAALMERNQQLYMDKWRPPVSPISITESQRISLCMIVRNSSRTLGACLQSVRLWVDEMIVVDTGSQDDTPRIAREAGAQLRHFPWCNSFAAARNESLKNAAGHWLFWMDSDDIIDEENGRKLRELAGRPHAASTLGFVMQVHCPAGEGGPYATQTVVDHIKMFRNLPGIRFTGRIHEQVLPSIRHLNGDVEWTDIHVDHSGSDQTPEGRVRKQQRDLRLLELELADDPDSTFARFNMGMTLLDMNRPEDALDHLCRSLQLAEPGESHVRKLFAFLAQAYANLGRPATALRTVERGLTVCPHDPELLFRRGGLELKMGRLREAEQSFQVILSTSGEKHFSSRDRGIIGIKAWHNLALVFEQQQRMGNAAEAWRRALEFDASNRVAWRALLDALHASNDANGLQLAAVDTRVPSDLRSIADALHSIVVGQPARAIKTLEEAMVQTSSLDLLQELCRQTFAQRLTDKAEQWLLELTKRCPQDAAAYLNLGTVYLDRKQYAKAAECAHRSLELRPNHPAAQMVLNSAGSLMQIHPPRSADNEVVATVSGHTA